MNVYENESMEIDLDIDFDSDTPKVSATATFRKLKSLGTWECKIIPGTLPKK